LFELLRHPGEAVQRRGKGEKGGPWENSRKPIVRLTLF